MIQVRIKPGVKWIAPLSRRLDGQLEIETAYFKKLFDMPNPSAKSLEIKISANNRYKLFVNGQEVMNGPCKGDEWHQYCDRIDIAPYLKAGTNVIAAKVVAFHAKGNRNEAGTNAGPTSLVAASLGPMLIVEGEASGVELSTGLADWFCKIDDAVAWKPEPGAWWAGNTEVVDGSKLMHGWASDITVDGFEPVRPMWNNEVAFGEIDSLFLYERPIPMPLTERVSGLKTMDAASTATFRGGKVKIAPNQKHTILLVAPRLTTSFVSLRTEGGAGATVTLGYSEGFVERAADGTVTKGDRLDSTGEFIGTSDIYRPGGGDEVYSPFLFRTFRIMRIEIVTVAEALSLHMPELTETRYPLENKVKVASKSDDWLAPVWDISLRTLQMCMHETYEDCPFYEQLQYTMDTRLQILFTYAISNDARMAGRTINDYHTSMLPEGMPQSRYPTNFRQVIPTFSLHYVLMLPDYYMETGDLELVKQYRFTLERILYWFHQRKGALGLVEKLGYWDFADWTDEWEAGISTAAQMGQPSTINNLIYVYALQHAAPLFYAMGMADLGAMYEKEAAEVLGAVMKHCWDNERQMLREGPGVDEFSQHAQLWAVLCGAISGREAQRLMDSVLGDERLIRCSFVMQYYLFRALELAGSYGKTKELWPLWADLLKDNLTTVPEIPGPKTRSDCHAWGALMLHEFPRKILGVSPIEPGYARIEIRPIADYIKDAAGTAPTPHGSVSVSRKYADGKFTMKIDTPVPARVVLPDGTMHNAAPGKHSFNCEYK